MEEFFEDEGTVTIFASNLNEVCIKVEWGMSPGYAAFTPKNARLIADALRKCADEMDVPAKPPRPVTKDQERRGYRRYNT